MHQRNLEEMMLVPHSIIGDTRRPLPFSFISYPETWKQDMGLHAGSLMS